MLPFLYLIIDVVIVLVFITAPWAILSKLRFQWPEWMKDGIAAVILLVIWAGVALYVSTQMILWLGLVP